MKNTRLLIVDDNPDIHGVIKYCLEEENTKSKVDELSNDLFDDLDDDLPTEEQNDSQEKKYSFNIDSAYSGEESIEMVKKAQGENNPYQIIIMDFRMPPGMNGLDALKGIYEVNPKVISLMCTAYADFSEEEITSQMPSPELFQFIRKPFDEDKMEQIIQSLVDKWYHLNS